MEEKKTAFLSGKLSGIKTLESELNSIKKPDMYESFLKEYVNVKFDINKDNEVFYLNDNQDFEEKIKEIEESDYMSLCVNNKFTRIYMTTDSKKTYVLRINKISSALISNLISKEKPIKFSLNSFPFFKWCNEKNIDIRNIYDIPTYIKILTNKIDVGNSFDYYIKKYTNQNLIEDDNELNNVIIGNFIYEFGRYLENYIEKFDLVNMCKIINENAYYESIKENLNEESIIKFSYFELDKIIDEMKIKIKKEYKDKCYFLSPLGRVALKYGRNEDELLNEIYNEDLETIILNELYTNNINVKLVGENLYVVSFKFKNFGSIASLISAILADVFNRMFEEKVEIKLECILKE